MPLLEPTVTSRACRTSTSSAICWRSASGSCCSTRQHHPLARHARGSAGCRLLAGEGAGCGRDVLPCRPLTGTRVYQLANRLSLPIVAKAVKPLPPFLMALKIGATRATVVIGDQLVTDVPGAFRGHESVPACHWRAS